MMKPHILVAGLGRCGTTLVMHMLKAGGVAVVGDAPSFEVDELNHREVQRTFLEKYPGHALKLLDPHLTPLPIDSAVKIWLDRDPKQQAKSQAKMAFILAGFPQPSRTHMRRWAASLRKETTEALSALPAGPLYRISFETIVAQPRSIALALASYLCPWWPDLDVAAMESRVLPRTSDCAPDLSVEFALLEQAEKAAA